MIGPPPRSTLFPSTTLFRSCPASRGAPAIVTPPSTSGGASPNGCTSNPRPTRFFVTGRSSSQWSVLDQCPGERSEEHTSELQSHLNLVCRLLLEKKKTRSHT